ncbi:MAG TPA: bifunctional riboflavin kinase/FAD synthetase [Candidatus Acidoferrales bacterium]|nr:bifunctional riboflavin kinase/FAD synthetase [Candidatus Acidoferrales bacterium]
MALARVDSFQEWRARFGEQRLPTAMTIGNFDGVHLGHQQILRRVVERAQKSNWMSAVLTFFPHPARVLRPEQAPPLLATLDQRLAAFGAAKIDAALVLNFDRELAQVTAEDFVQRYLVETMRAKTVLVGGSFRFGHRQAGDVNLLRELGTRWSFEVDVVPPVTIEGVAVSSTAVREAVRDGRMEDARKLLGRPYALVGQIRPGTGQGRKLVVPTLNLAAEQELLPKMGVYATQVALDGKVYRAATNVGVRPTFDGTRTTVESHILDFSENRASGSMEVRFCTRLRDEKKFSGPEALREQVLKDIERAREYFEAAKQVS